MGERAATLRARASGQLTELIGLISASTDDVLRRPCPGREKLGDGTVGALAAHTADHYVRIAEFVTARIGPVAEQPGPGQRHQQRRGPEVPRLLRTVGHRPSRHASHGHGSHDGPGMHAYESRYITAGMSRDELVQRLTSARSALSRIADLGDEQLEAVPPKDSFRFCDGERTLEQVLSALLTHQDSQVKALGEAVN